MRKLIYAINVTIDGFADHTAVIADDELHDFHTDLLDSIDTILLGRNTYELMESFWPTADKNPISTKSMIRFADKINNIPKIVFSKKLEKVSWGKYDNAALVKENIVEEVLKLKEKAGKSLGVGGLSIASAFTNEGLIDEYWFLIQPIILGNGKQLFGNLEIKRQLELVDIRKFNSGVVALNYKKI